MKVKYEYTSIYNRRPEEGYGMGTENLTVSGESDLMEFLERLQHNSSLRHTDNKMFIVSTETMVEIPEWNDWIGQPMFFIVDIKIVPIEA